MKAIYRQTASTLYKIRGDRYTLVTLDPLFPQTQIMTGLLPANKAQMKKIMGYPTLKKAAFDKAFKSALKNIKNLT